MKRNRADKMSGKWEESDLVRRACHALDIAKLTVEQFAANGYVHSTDPAKNVRSEKVLSETAILVLHASSIDFYPDVRTRIASLAEYLIPFARSERTLLGLCLEPSLAWDYALPHVCLARLGYADAQFDELLSRSVRSSAHAGRERVPHRLLEQEWLARGWNETKGARAITHSRAARASILSRPLDLFGGTRDDIYAFTHALMYVTDFNLRPAPLPRPRPMILGEAEAALSRSVDDQDYDLAGEVLLSWPLTGKSWSASATFAFRVLARVEDKAGFLPTPSTRIAELDALDGPQRKQLLLATAYHTAYVMGLLCVASLRPGFAPPMSVPMTASKCGSAKKILAAIDLDSPSAHWQEEFQELTAAEADSLAGFLINVGLHRRIAKRDFGGVRQLLELAWELDLANTPAASQSAQLLDRISTLSKFKQNARCGPPRDQSPLAAIT